MLEVKTNYKFTQEKRVVQEPKPKQEGLKFTPVEHRHEWLSEDDFDMLIECTELRPGEKAEDHEHMLEVNAILKRLRGRN